LPVLGWLAIFPYMETKLNYIVADGVYTPVGNLSNVVQQLPPAVYVIRDIPMQGTKLFRRDSVDTSVPKTIYGKIPSYLSKTFSAFDRRPLNTGVLLSGERGMGKTMFVRMAINEAISRGLAVINIDSDTNVSSAVSMINGITQPLLVVMDEFEKNFSANSDDDDEDDSSSKKQVPFLSMLDGMGSSEKRLYLATVNDTKKLSKYLLNRPGRFYYHFEFRPLNEADMREYLTHEVSKASKKAIDYAVSVMQSYSINYDGIAAIADELNSGISIEETIHDLNLDRVGETSQHVSVKLDGLLYQTTEWASLDEIRENKSYCINVFAVNCVDRSNDKYFLGNCVTMKFDGTKMCLSKGGSIVVPKSAILDISLNYEVTLRGSKKPVSHLTPNDVNVSDIHFSPMHRVTGAVYMDI